MSTSRTTPNSSKSVPDLIHTLPASQKFNAADADVTFKSSDGVCFFIHRKNLNAHCGAFPLGEGGTRRDIVSLAEDSSTLEHLFDFMYPQRHPSIDLLSSEDFFRVAEAAEKYEVFTVMNICNMRMKQIFVDHPAKAFSYGAKHDYIDICNLAAPLMLDIPLEEIVTQISPHLVIPWVRYWKCWYRAAQKVMISRFPDATSVNHKKKNNRDHCSNCGRGLGPGLSNFTIGADQPLSRKSLRELLLTAKRCSNCSGTNAHSVEEEDFAELENALNEVPEFSTFS